MRLVERKNIKTYSTWDCSKTGSRKIILWLNRFGHSLSYKEVNVVETRLAEEQSNRECHKRYVPNNIQPSPMVTFVYDNCDHNVEYLHGLAMHCTNGIVIQRSTPNANALNVATATEVGLSGSSMVRLPKKSPFMLHTMNSLHPFIIRNCRTTNNTRRSQPHLCQL